MIRNDSAGQEQVYGDHFVMYTDVESRDTPETNMVLQVNYTSKTKTKNPAKL